jgi:hypothetical protein
LFYLHCTIVILELDRVVLRFVFFLLILVFSTPPLFSQGVGIPSKNIGVGFGNLPFFKGIRFNVRDRNVERVTGVNVTLWSSKNDDRYGTVRGIALGLPKAAGVENQYGIVIGLASVGAARALAGLHIAGLDVDAGETITGLSLAGVGIGSNGDLNGVSIAGVGAGAGGNVQGLTLGGLGIGAKGNIYGFSFGGLGIGSNQNIAGVNIGGLGVGAARNVSGFSVSLIGIGAGTCVRGITLSGLGIGAGEQVKGIAVAGLGIGSYRVAGFAVAPAVGGELITGVMIAPAYLRVGAFASKYRDESFNDEPDTEGLMRGVSISAFNQVNGDQVGVTIGIVNYTRRIKGFQLGLINIVKENPKWLRVLPIFNTRFRNK